MSSATLVLSITYGRDVCGSRVLFVAFFLVYALPRLRRWKLCKKRLLRLSKSYDKDCNYGVIMQLMSHSECQIMSLAGSLNTSQYRRRVFVELFGKLFSNSLATFCDTFQFDTYLSSPCL